MGRLFIIFFILLNTSCASYFSTKKITSEGLTLPFIKNTANECYFLDEFMPVPNNMVTGRTGSISLRYYTYHSAFYKDWPESQIVLSFYSTDERCWSLFEEYFVVQ